MKTNIFKIMALTLIVSGLGFASCQQNEVAEILMAKKEYSNNIVTRANSIKCIITTTKAGQLDSLLTIQSNEDPTKPREYITHLIINGPVNKADANAIIPLAYLDTLNLTGATLMDDSGIETTKLPNRMFWGMQGKAHITLPNSLTAIGHGAFHGSGITSIIIPNNVTEIFSDGNNSTWYTETTGSTFGSCSNLTNVILPENLAKIGDYTFQNCTSLKSIILPKNLIAIGDYAFEGCTQLESISHWPSSMTTIPTGVFKNCERIQFEIPEYITSIGDEAFYGCKQLKSIELPRNLTSLGQYGSTFSYSGITEIIIPEKITRIPGSCFSECKNLEKVVIPASITYMGATIFYGCSALKEVILTEGLKMFSTANIFEGCTSLSTLTFPSTIQEITSIHPHRAMSHNCPNLHTIYWNSTNCAAPDFMGDSDRNLFVYLAAGGSSVNENPNQIVNGVAQAIRLQSDGAYVCSQEFKANVVKYERNYSNWSSLYNESGVASRWETITLPYEVTTITTEDGRILAPFGSEITDAKPFWLYELTADGFKQATKIEAHKPYIIAMPNNPNYLDEYNIRCKVTFAANNVQMEPTPELKATAGPRFSLTPVYNCEPKRSDMFTLNREQYQDFINGNVMRPVGSVFVPTERDAMAFEAAYFISVASSRCIPLFGDGTTTRTTKKLGKVPQLEDMMPF